MHKNESFSSALRDSHTKSSNGIIGPVAVGSAFPECYTQSWLRHQSWLVAVGSAFPECYTELRTADETGTVAVGSAFPECYTQSNPVDS